jgi:SAM-dependent methyltransferase
MPRFRGLRSPASATATAVATVEPEPEPTPDDGWFRSHVDAGHEVVDFLAGDGITLAGKRVADIGCGDGIIDLAIAVIAQPAELIGYDLNRTDEDGLLERARANHFVDELPSNLAFSGSDPGRLPAEDASFDALVSWSCFEHVVDPIPLAREMRRIIRPDGVLFLQLWPFYYSASGAHLDEWFPGGQHVHLTTPDDEIERVVRADDLGTSWWPEYKWSEYVRLNRITVDELQAALLAGGFLINKVQLISDCVHIPPQIAHMPLSKLAVSGIKLQAVPL